MKSPAVIVVGGGPAGLATAIALRARGLSVRVLERGAPPIDKACGEGVMPDGLGVLDRLGIDTSRLEGHPFEGVAYLDGDLRAEADFPSRPGRGIRRTVLHRALVDRAEEVGAELRFGSVVTAVGQGGVETENGPESATWVVGADGLGSRVRRWAGLGAPYRGPVRFGVRRHFEVAPWSRRVEVHWADSVEAYVTLVGPRKVGVALLWSGFKADFDGLLERFPALQERLAGRPVTSRTRGAGRLARPVRRRTRGNLLLVGDAAGYLDAITGEGLSLAFREAELAAEALAEGRLDRYERRVRRLVRRPEWLIRGLLVAEQRPWLRRRLVGSLARKPELFADLLAVHVGERRLGARIVARLAAGLLR